MKLVITFMVILAVSGLVITLVVPGPLHYWGTAIIFVALFIATALHRRKGNESR